MEIVHGKSVIETTQLASAELNRILKEYNSEPVLLLVSGGTALELVQNIDPNVVDPTLTVCVLDERFSEDEYINTFSQVMTTEFYQRAQEKSVNFIRTKVLPGETLEQFAERYEKGIIDWRVKNPTGLIFATVGMGPDGHTAGIMPHPEDLEKFKQLFENEDNIITAYQTIPEKTPYTERATVTLPFMRNRIDKAIMYVAGPNKARALAEALQPGSVAEIPARVWQNMKDVKIFTDINLD